MAAPAQSGTRSHGKRAPRWLAERLRRAGYLRKWIALGAAIGVIAGLGAAVFMIALRTATGLLLGHLAGYVPPAPAGEGVGIAGTTTFLRPWAIPLVTGFGGLLSGIAVFGFAPEAEGHGTDAAIHAFHHDPTGVRGRVSLVKIVASAVTIGAGGSAGREGPAAQISAAFGSTLARFLDLAPNDARIAVAVGIGAGIGAIFRAPLGGAVLGVEILYRDDVEVEGLVPSIIASIVAFSLFGAFEGFAPVFGYVEGYRFEHPMELCYYAVLGLVAGLLGRLYASAFYGIADAAARLPLRPMIRPALAGVLVGLLGLVIPGALGTGYGWVQQAMGDQLLAIPLWMVLALPFAKILATSLSIGSGASGGIFGPGMVVGGFAGAALWRLTATHLPGVPASPAPFVVVGMIACFGSIAHAPLAVMLMVSEMTGTLSLLPPAMVAVSIGSIVVGDTTIYRSQLRNRADSPAHRFRFGLPMLSALPVREVVTAPRVVLESGTTAADARRRLDEADVPGAPVVDEKQRFVGTVVRERLLAAPADAHVDAATDTTAPTVPVDAVLEDVVELLAGRSVGWVTVLDGNRVVGVVAASDLVRGYRRALRRTLQRIGGVGTRTALVEQPVLPGSVFADRTVGTAEWPPGTFVVSVQRGEQLLFPDAHTPLQAGDVVSLLVRAESADAVRLALAQTTRDLVRPARGGPEFV